MMPAPTHLREIVEPADAATEELSFAGKLRCPCGDKRFHVLVLPFLHSRNGRVTPVTGEINGKFFFIVRAQCAACARDLLVFDKDFHGWNGFVCHDKKQAKLKRPKTENWECCYCETETNEHEVTVSVRGEGREDFVEETEGEFDEDRWPDGFGSICIGIKCCSCGHDTPDWVSYETM